MKKVFISYSHKDKDWVRGWLLPRLENHAIETHIDYRDFEIGVASVLNMERAVEKCAKTLLVLTQNWIDSEFTQFEGIMVQTDDPIGLHKKILPLKLDGCELPRRLKILTYADFRDEDNWDFELGRLCKQIKEDFAKLAPPKVTWPPLGDENIDIRRLPRTPYELFGRQRELKTLNEVWEAQDTNVVSFVAYGGTGKSTLVNKWLEKLRWDNYRGAKKVFGWSFYSQGTSQRVTSADKFISKALAWFGDPEPKKGSPWDKGQRLAELVRKEETLLILDGVEPLQSGHDFEKGRIKDAALSMLVAQLARNNNGLCVITTRQEVAELQRFDKCVLQLNLNQISQEAGRALLRVGGIQGTDGELEAASEQFGNHALAINLLASYLHGIEGHHIENAASIADLDIPEEKGRHPRRVIAAFEERFGEGPQIQLLNILGLFDRPAEMAAIEAVYKDSPIDGLTDQLQGLAEAQLNKVLEGLRDLKLLAHKSKHNPNVVDCHPLVREHFGEKLLKDKPQAWREAHLRLYEYYRRLAEKLYAKSLPDSLCKMEPVFAAIAHGCPAGKHEDARLLYRTKIKQHAGSFITDALGALGAELELLSNFFVRPWSRVVVRKGFDHGFVQCVAGVRLKGIGWLKEAELNMRAGLDLHIANANWEHAANTARHLSNLYLITGHLDSAVEFGAQGVKWASRSHDRIWFTKMAALSAEADAHHHAGRYDLATTRFEAAEKTQLQRRSARPFLYGLQGCRYCDLLLAKGMAHEVAERVPKMLASCEDFKFKVGYGLSHISSALSNLIRGRQAQAEIQCDRGVALLREASQIDKLVLGLLARAGIRRNIGDFEGSWGDVEEAREIAERGQMKMNLYLADYHLEAARLRLAESQDSECRMEKLKEAGQHYEEAAKRVEDMGYHRREPELLLIKAELQSRAGDKAAAKKTLQTAERRINEMGCHRWDIEAESLQSKL